MEFVHINWLLLAYLTITVCFPIFVQTGWLSSSESKPSTNEFGYRGQLVAPAFGPGDELEPCPNKCNVTLCPPITKCSVGLVRDRCECCSVCGLEQDQLCNLDADIPKMVRGGPGILANAWHGRCGANLECRLRTDVDVKMVGRQSICYCLKDGLVCGSNGVTYTKCQMAAIQEISNGTIVMVSQGPCKSEPKILMISQSREVKEGEKITFICEVQGYPMPTVNWYFVKPGSPHDSQILPGDANEVSVSLRGGPQVAQLTSHLQITEFSLKQEGEYHCTAENDLGMATKSLSVIVSTSEGNSFPNSGKERFPKKSDWGKDAWGDL